MLSIGCAFGGRRDAGPKGNPDEALRRLDAVEAAARKDPSLAARAGWMRYLVASDSRGAKRWLEPAAEAGPERALALAGLAEIAEDRADTSAAVRLWIRALQIAPLDPASELAAVRLLDAEGESPAVDDAIAAAAQDIRPPMAPRTARLLREAAARIAGRRAQGGEVEAESNAWRAVGAIQRWRVAGPVAALRLFDLSKTLVLDGPAPARVTANERALDFPDGDLGLDLEPADGDLFYSASEIALARGGKYLLWVEGAAALEVRVDGVVAVSRVPYPRESPRAQTVAVELAAGKHDVLARWTRSEGSHFRVALVRGDGAPSDLQSAAPAALTGMRAANAPCALGRACIAPPAWSDKSDLRAATAAMLEKDPGDALAAWLQARASLGDDRSLSRSAVEKAVALSASGAPALALRAQQLLHDPDVPDRIGRARALADLSEAARRDPALVRARLTAAALERDAERFDDAALDLDRAEASLREELGPDAPLAPRMLTARARLLDARGNTAGARAAMEAALKTAPGRCDSLQLLYELSRREGALAEQVRLAESLLTCNEGLSTLAQLLRDRGDLARAEALFARGISLRPAAPARLELLGEVQAARNELLPAIASVEAAAKLSPRSPEPLRRLAGLLELAGNAKRAAGTRRAALRLTPGDLSLRQQLALDEKTKLMSWTDRDAVALAQRAAPAAAAPPGASAVRLLDYGAAQMFPDNGGVERVHTLVRVLDKKGVSRFGEAQIPSDAQVLHLRTLKADGRVLEPESIPEKEAISLPGLEPGDAVEIDYLRGISPRGPEMPGYTLGGFFFRDDETPMGETTYEVVAPGPLDVDAHNLQLPKDALARDGQSTRFRYSARDVPPLQQEPHQPGENEIIPWVQVGTGASQRDLVRSVADWALLRARPSTGVDALARDAGGGAPREKAEKIFAAISQLVRGRSQGTDFSASAAHVLSQGRGNRLLVLKAALSAAGIPSHLVLVRAFNVDPAPYRFPRGELYGYAVLRIDLPDGPVWADTSYRLASFGQLPAFARGQPGWALPEPGEEPSELRTPEKLPGQQDGRAVSLELQLDPQGAATGTGRDEHRGFEAASLKDALERLDRDQRKQAVEAMLGRGLRDLSLETLTTERESELGGPATLLYGLRVQLARRDAEKLFVPSSLLPSRLGRRWAAKAERSVPLLIDSPEAISVKASVALPRDRRLRGVPQPVALSTPFGQYRWSARQESGKLVIEESLELPQQRVAPAKYADFIAFARAVDEAQSQELIVAP